MKGTLYQIMTHALTGWAFLIGDAARTTIKLKESIAEPMNHEQQETLCGLIDDLETIMDKLDSLTKMVDIVNAVIKEGR